MHILIYSYIMKSMSFQVQLPIAYHGRASSIVVFGTDIMRPSVIGIRIVAAGFYSLMWGQAKEKNKLVVRMEEDLVVGDEPVLLYQNNPLLSSLDESKCSSFPLHTMEEHHLLLYLVLILLGQDASKRTSTMDTCYFTQVVYNANILSKLVNEKKTKRNWLDYYQLKFDRSNQSERPLMKISKEREKIIANSKYVMPAAFVSFKSRWGAAVFRRLIIAMAFFFLTFFFMIPIAFVQSLANIDGIVKAAPFIEFVNADCKSSCIK
ncbi:CSC1-like protein, partial [Tanacetum coccineum]